MNKHEDSPPESSADYVGPLMSLKDRGQKKCTALITESSTEIDVNGYYTAYHISIQYVTSTWILFRRYSQFLSLHHQLLKSKIPNLPNLPPKKYFGNLDDAFVEKRMKELNEYIKCLLLLPKILDNKIVRSFFAVPDQDVIDSMPESIWVRRTGGLKDLGFKSESSCTLL